MGVQYYLKVLFHVSCFFMFQFFFSFHSWFIEIVDSCFYYITDISRILSLIFFCHFMIYNISLYIYIYIFFLSLFKKYFYFDLFSHFHFSHPLFSSNFHFNLGSLFVGHRVWTNNPYFQIPLTLSWRGCQFCFLFLVFTSF